MAPHRTPRNKKQLHAITPTQSPHDVFVPTTPSKEALSMRPPLASPPAESYDQAQEDEREVLKATGAWSVSYYDASHACANPTTEDYRSGPASEAQVLFRRDHLCHAMCKGHCNLPQIPPSFDAGTKGAVEEEDPSTARGDTKNPACRTGGRSHDPRHRNRDPGHPRR